jgi:hypothetical protein
MEWIGCVRCEKSWCDFVAPCFSSSFMQLRNDPKCTQTLCNGRKHEFRVQWSGLGVFVAKNPDVTSWHELLHYNCTSTPCLHRVSCSYEMIPNASQHYATHQNMSLGSNGVDSVLSLWKILTSHRGTNFCINCTSSHCFAPSFMQLRHDPKCTQTLCNAPKHEFRVQWGGLRAFVVKNLDLT